MDLLEAIGRRRSIRWFKPWEPVPLETVQRVLEAARMTGSPGNLQPWRAVVVEPARLDPSERQQLLEANNVQRAQELAPVWIYWYADPESAVPDVFLAAGARAAAGGRHPGRVRVERRGGARRDR